MGVFKKINFGLRKTRNSMSGAIDNVLDSYTSIDEQLFDELEEALVMGDVGVATASEITMRLNDRVRKNGIRDTSGVKDEIKEIVAEMLQGGEDMGLVTIPSVILVIGVNGVGKTTTIGKMAAMYRAQGKRVILGAADTFRAAAIDQLEIWAQRAGVEIVKHKEGADPAAVVFDTISAAKARDCDIIICDTAGRLHNKKNLMDELAKIYRVIDRELPYSDRESLLVLDATTGQNAVNQAREFKSVAEITGIVLTKLDGTARGGVVLAIKNELGVPVKFIGVGEGIDDLQPFSPEAFAQGLFDDLPEDFAEEETSYLGELMEGEEYTSYKEEAARQAKLEEERAQAEAEALRELDEALSAALGGDDEESTEPEIEAEAEPEVETEAEPEVETEAEPVVETEVEPEVEIEAEPEVETEAEPEVETEDEPVVETEVEPEVEIEAEPVVETEVEPEVETEAEPVAEAITAEESEETASEPEEAVTAPQESGAQAQPEKKKKGFFGRLFG